MNIDVASSSSLASPSFAAKSQARADRLFNKLDKDKDGSVSQSEFQDFAKRLGLNGADAFKSADSDGDGKISKSEFEQALSKLKPSEKGGVHHHHKPVEAKPVDDKPVDASVSASPDSENKVDIYV